jgi:hypothetical protein
VPRPIQQSRCACGRGGLRSHARGHGSGVGATPTAEANPRALSLIGSTGRSRRLACRDLGRPRSEITLDPGIAGWGAGRQPVVRRDVSSYVTAVLIGGALPRPCDDEKGDARDGWRCQYLADWGRGRLLDVVTGFSRETLKFVAPGARYRARYHAGAC